MYDHSWFLQDEALVDGLISRKTQEGMAFPDENFPDNKDLTVYKCWDSTRWSHEAEVEAQAHTTHMLQDEARVAQHAGSRQCQEHACSLFAGES